MEISSKDNTVIKLYKELAQSRKSRYEKGLFAIEGEKLCREAAENVIEIKVLLVTADYILKHGTAYEEISRNSEKIYTITNSLSKKIGDTGTPQGVFAICKMLDKNIETNKACGKIILLENLQDPGNMGTIIRTADAFGIDAIIISADCVDVYSQKVLRATTGSVFRQRIFVSDNLVKTAEDLKKSGIGVFSAVVDTDAEKIGELTFPKSCAVAIGNEGAGLTDELKAVSDCRVTIKMKGKTESLNAGVAAAVIMWEMTK